MNDELKKLLLELESLGELYFGMIEYFENRYNRDKEIDPNVILQSFKFIWNIHYGISNRYIPLIRKLIEINDAKEFMKEEGKN